MKILNEEIIKALKAIQKAGVPSFDTSTNTCSYRGSDNPKLKCLIGHLISDEVYIDGIEGFDVNQIQIILVVQRSLGIQLTHTDRYMLKELQLIHDDAAKTDDFILELFRGILRSSKDISMEIRVYAGEQMELLESMYI